MVENIDSSTHQILTTGDIQRLNVRNKTQIRVETDEAIGGNSGDDLIVGGPADDLLMGDVGNDTIYGGNGNNTLVGGTNHFMIEDWAGQDLLVGGSGNDLSFGNQGDDTLYGGEGDDTLYGGKDNDFLLGNGGNDVLFGDLGSDSLWGGEGQNYFQIGRRFDVPGFLSTGGPTPDNADWIIDFTPGQDLIGLLGGLTFDELNIFAGTGENAGNTIIQDKINQEYLAILQNISPEAIARDNFSPYSAPPVPSLPSLNPLVINPIPQVNFTSSNGQVITPIDQPSDLPPHISSPTQQEEPSPSDLPPDVTPEIEDNNLEPDVSPEIEDNSLEPDVSPEIEDNQDDNNLEPDVSPEIEDNQDDINLEPDATSEIQDNNIEPDITPEIEDNQDDINLEPDVTSEIEDNQDDINLEPDVTSEIEDNNLEPDVTPEIEDNNLEPDVTPEIEDNQDDEPIGNENPPGEDDEPIGNETPPVEDGEGDETTGEIEDNPIDENGGDDSSGDDSQSSITVTYSDAMSGIIADLSEGIVTRLFTTSDEVPFKILPLGDSNTRGFPNQASIGGYRTRLWQKLVGDNGFNIDFVGQANSGPQNIDRDHEGRGGFTIDELIDNNSNFSGFNQPTAPLYTTIENTLNYAQPDAVLLMAGTNDILQNKPVETALTDLGILVDRIITAMPDIQVLVSSIIPHTSPNINRQQRTTEFSQQVEEVVVSPRSNTNPNIRFVDMFNLPFVTGDYDKDGIHLTTSGYDKLADQWYSEIRMLPSGEETLSNVQNIIGSDSDDTLIGDDQSNVIRGAQGNDWLIGGGGEDTFILAPGEGTNTIADFESGIDRIGLTDGLEFEQLLISSGSDASQTQIAIADTGESLAILLGIDSTLINADDFILI